MKTHLSHRILIVLGLVLGAIISALMAEYMLSEGLDRPFGHTRGAHVIGWLGLFFIGLTFVYPYKRKYHPNTVWPKRWFQVHMVGGIVGPMIIFLHAGAHFHAWVPIFALVSMVLVVGSGITGQAVHYLAFRMLYERRHQLAEQGMSDAAIEARLHDLALQEETLRWWKCWHGPLTWLFVVMTALHVGGAIFFGGL